jgi:sirohydrochlorin ferrochelatase
VVVPLLLTAAYHSKADIPAQLAAAAAARPGLDVVSAGTLGPHPLLLTAMERRLREAGVATGDAVARAGTGVVLAAAGSSDPAANATIAELAARWARERGWRAVLPGYASAAGPRPADCVRALRDGGAERVVVATYLLAPGHFADKIRDAAHGAGADAVSAALGDAPEVADVVLDRYLAADLAGRRAAGRLGLTHVAVARIPVSATPSRNELSGVAGCPSRSPMTGLAAENSPPRAARNRPSIIVASASGAPCAARPAAHPSSAATVRRTARPVSLVSMSAASSRSRRARPRARRSRLSRAPGRG